ncbi:MAG: tRNA1(Val) (adenine(37)-N6)-methyltransferase [Psychroflexus salarius]
MSKPFHFKQFSITQANTAMKIGTDGVLLGAWASIKHQPDSILDIGAGTGIISLQLAQRSSAQLIDAIEIDHNAYEDCVTNFENSIWNDRLFCYHASLQEFVDEIDESYDLIISNPPFFEPQNSIKSSARTNARFTNSLNYKELLQSVRQLLNQNGKFCVIIPYQNEAKFLDIAQSVELFPTEILHVKGHKEAPIKRSLICLEHKLRTPVEVTELTIEIERHQYTTEYFNLVKDFYLKL